MGHFEKEYCVGTWDAALVGVSPIKVVASVIAKPFKTLIILVGVIVFIVPNLAGVRCSFDKLGSKYLKEFLVCGIKFG